MQETWRWFGPDDPIPLEHVRQTGASGLVTALHHIYDGRAWTVEDVATRKGIVEDAGFTWPVCESIPVDTSLKLRSGPWRRYLDQWKDSLAALGRGGVPTVCYNFMPVVDWTRTHLDYPMPSSGIALRFDMTDFVGYDVFVLKRAGAANDYPGDQVEAGRKRIEAMTEAEIDALEHNVIAGLPGGEGRHDRKTIAAAIAQFDGVTSDDMKANLHTFLREIVPVAEDVGVRLAIHPDDPPFSLFGLPRVISTADDARALLAAVESQANGLTLCAGSYGARPDNDLPAMAREFGPRIHFVHLRNVTLEADGSFIEADHLGGNIDMAALIQELLAEETRRRAEGRVDAEIPMRPDHGHLLADDIGKKTNPGYSLIGRMKGLAELRGMMAAIKATPACTP